MILKDPIQIVFLLCATFYLVGFGPFNYYMYKFTVKASNNRPEGYPFPSWRDLKFTLLSTLVIGLLD